MKRVELLLYFFVFKIISLGTDDERPIINALDIIPADGYAVQLHRVVTKDGYILEMHRIQNCTARNETKSSILIQHGLYGSSSLWITMSKGSILPYALCEMGYDVWLGNARGSSYSKMHVNRSTLNMDYWDFSFHEIALFDMPAMIDYILERTNQTSLHYIAYSQGGTNFLVLTSTMAEYNGKIKSAHLFCPIAYMAHSESPIVTYMGPIFGKPSPFVEFLAKTKANIIDKATFKMLTNTCMLNVRFIQYLCEQLIYLLYGYKSPSKAAIPGLISTALFEGSNKQAIHFLQGYISGEFRQYDHGEHRNQIVYGQTTPPGYSLESITAPTFIYFANHDWYVHGDDLRKLKGRLNLANTKYINISVDNWGHMDFLWSPRVRDVIHVKLFQYLNDYD